MNWEIFLKRMAFFMLLCLSSFSTFALDEIVKKQEFKMDTYQTVAGQTIKNVRIGYETYGKLNEEKTNAILITHYFTGNSHAAGKFASTDVAPGYWDAIIGPGKPLDTDKYFVISSDTLANLTPTDPNTITTGPSSINPATKKPYGMSFPLVGVRDFVQVQKKLVESMGIKKLALVAGASGGAAQALEWSAAYPEDVAKVLAVIGPGLSLPPYVIALLNIWSAPILLDSKWKNGNYYKSGAPLKGVTESLKLITLSSLSFDWAQQTGGGLEKEDKLPLKDYKNKYAIEALLHGRAEGRASKIDANSLLYMAKAIQSYNIEKDLGAIKAEILFIPVRTDMIFPPEFSVSAAKTLCDAGKKASVKILETKGGHLDGLFKITDANKDITDFMSGKNKTCKF
jgi:homoserine O-acetyltransferase